MTIEPLSTQEAGSVQEIAAIKTLKNSLHVQEQAALKLLESLSAITDPALGRNVDISA